MSAGPGPLLLLLLLVVELGAAERKRRRSRRRTTAAGRRTVRRRVPGDRRTPDRRTAARAAATRTGRLARLRGCSGRRRHNELGLIGAAGAAMERLATQRRRDDSGHRGPASWIEKRRADSGTEWNGCQATQWSKTRAAAAAAAVGGADEVNDLYSL